MQCIHISSSRCVNAFVSVKKNTTIEGPKSGLIACKFLLKVLESGGIWYYLTFAKSVKQYCHTNSTCAPRFRLIMETRFGIVTILFQRDIRFHSKVPPEFKGSITIRLSPSKTNLLTPSCFKWGRSFARGVPILLAEDQLSTFVRHKLAGGICHELEFHLLYLTSPLGAGVWTDPSKLSLTLLKWWGIISPGRIQSQIWKSGPSPFSAG